MSFRNALYLVRDSCGNPEEGKAGSSFRGVHSHLYADWSSYLVSCDSDLLIYIIFVQRLS